MDWSVYWTYWVQITIALTTVLMLIYTIIDALLDARASRELKQLEAKRKLRLINE